MFRSFVASIALLLLAACGGGGGGSGVRAGFLTADARGLTSNGASGAEAPGAGAATAADGIERAIEEADLYRLNGDRLYLVNSWRGFVVVDLAAPALLGRLAMTGIPQEMFLKGAHAYVLLSTFDGGTQVLDVSVATPATPSLVATFSLAGTYRTSRLVGDVLYVLTDSALSSFTAAGDLAAVSTLPIPGGAWFAHATDAFFFVAASDGFGDTRVTLVDISNLAGSMSLRGSMTFPGYLSDEFKLHFGAGMLRVVTHDWVDGGLSRLFLVDVSSPDTPITRGTLDLARGEQLFATRFTEEAAFLVTFERVDPLWVVDLRDPDAPVVSGFLTVPGWSTHLVALPGRLVALGLDPSDWHATASLYDVSDPTLPTMSSRVDFGAGWSSAFYDVKGFGVFEPEGLVLIPFSGETNELAVLSLTPTTLALRGSIAAEGTVVRGFPHARGLCTISTEEVVVANPTTLAPTGRVTVAQNVPDVLRLPDGTIVEAIRRSAGCRVGGVDLPIGFASMVPFGTSVAVTGWDGAGQAVYVIDFSTAPATVSARLDAGQSSYAYGNDGRDALAPNGIGIWGGFGASASVLSSDGRLAVHAAPAGVPGLSVGTGDVTDGFVVIDIGGARVETTVAIRGGYSTGFVADGADLVFTYGSFAGDDRAGRPLMLHDLVRVHLAAHTMAPVLNVPGYVVAADAGIVYTIEETWGSGWAFESHVVASDVTGSTALALDRLPLPPGSYDTRAAGHTLYVTTYGAFATGGIGSGPTVGSGGGGSPSPGGVPNSASAEIATIRLSASLSFGPSIVYDTDFASLLLPEDGGALVVRNGVTVDRWDVSGPVASLAWSSDAGTWPESARSDTLPGTYLLALGYGGWVNAP